MIYKENDKSLGICENCEKLVTTIFKYAPLKSENTIIPNILQGFCNICGESISIPYQEVAKIKEFREKRGI